MRTPDMNGRWIRALGLSAAIWLGAVSTAASQSAARDAGESYGALVQEAVEEFNRGHWEEAGALFKRAHALRPNARTLRGIGLSAFESRRYVDTVQHLTQALSTTANPLTRKQREEVQRTLQKAERLVSKLRLRLHPPEARVTVDGSPIELDAEETLLDPGAHELAISAPAHRLQTHRVQMRAGEQVELEIALEPAPESQPSGQPATGATAWSAPGLSRERTASGDPALVASDSSDADTEFQVWKWLAAGTAASAAAVGIAAVVIRGSALERWNDDAFCLQGGRTREANCGADFDNAQTATTVAIVSLSAAGALTVTAIALFVLDSPSAGAADSALRLCGPGPSAASLTCSVRF